MRWMLRIVLLLAVTVFSFISCTPEDETVFDQTLLIGKWQSSTLFYRYDTGGQGVTWDTADDVTEAEGQAFTWTLVKSDLTHIYVTEMGAFGSKAVGIPKVYTVQVLSATRLVYKDAFGKSYSFTKVIP